MAAQQKRMLTAERGKLSKADLTVSKCDSALATQDLNIIQIILRKEGAWDALPVATRTQLYSLLPEPGVDEEPHDISVNPLKTKFRPFIEEALRTWQDDLKAGKETKKWRERAMQAGSDRADGRFDEYMKAQREEYWGDAATEDEKAESSVPDSQEDVNGDDGSADDADEMVKPEQ